MATSSSVGLWAEFGGVLVVYMSLSVLLKSRSDIRASKPTWGHVYPARARRPLNKSGQCSLFHMHYFLPIKQRRTVPIAKEQEPCHILALFCIRPTAYVPAARNSIPLKKLVIFILCNSATLLARDLLSLFTKVSILHKSTSLDDLFLCTRPRLTSTPTSSLK